MKEEEKVLKIRDDKFEIRKPVEKLFVPTMGLRWKSRPASSIGRKENNYEAWSVLQQAWQDVHSGEIEWRNVPNAEEGE